MKIESIGQIKEVEQIQIISEYAVPKFSEGEILIAQVENIQGDKVMLKNKEGQVFMALMQSDLGLSEGNVVEVAASRNGTGFVLHLLDVEKSINTPGARLAAEVITDTLAAMKANPGIDPKAASFLIENNIPRTPENISALARMVHGGPGLGALLAEILTGLDKSVQPQQAMISPETGDNAAQTQQAQGTPGNNIMPQDKHEVFTGVNGGINYIVDKLIEQAGTAGKQTTAITEGMAAAQANGGAQQTTAQGGAPHVSSGAVQYNGNGEPVSTQTNAAENAEAGRIQPGFIYTAQKNPEEAVNAAAGKTAEAANASATQNAGAAYASNMQNPAASTPAETAAAAAGGAAGQITGEGSQTILKEGIMTAQESPAEQVVLTKGGVITEQDTAMYLKQADPQNVPEQLRTINKEEIRDRILAMFCRPDKQTAAQFKKTITDIPDGLDALKLLLLKTDKDDKGALFQKAEQAQKQTELLSESKRFDCIQVPFMLKNGAEKTAELYVYRHKRNQKESGETGLSVLVALDTQHIGRVETLMKTAGKNISLEFRLERKEIQPEIIKRSKGLAKAMENAGYTLKSLKITGLEMRTTVLNAGGVLIPDAGVSPGNIDVQI